MPDLVLDEPSIGTILSQVGDECRSERGDNTRGTPSASRWATKRALISAGLIRPPPLGHPKCRMIHGTEPRTDVLDVVGDRVDGPAHHRGDVAPPRRLPAHRLAVTDMQHPEPTELRRRRVTAPVGQIQLRGLGAPQPQP